MGKATNEILDRRLRIMKTFLRKYKKPGFEVPENYDEVKYRKWEEVQETGLTFKEFYYCMCGDPKILKLGKKSLSESSIRGYLKKIDYLVYKDGYIYKEASELKQIAVDRLYNCLEYNKSEKSYIVSNNGISIEKSQDDEDSDIELREYCIVVSFESNEGLHSIAEAISDAYVKSIDGVIIGVKMIRIYTSDFNKAILIQKRFMGLENTEK